MTTVAVGVVAHPDRMEDAEALSRRVSAEVIRYDLQPRHLPPQERANLNHDAVWADLATVGKDWCVVLEDDAIPVDGFRYLLPGVLGRAPSPVVSLYTGVPFPGRVQSALAWAHKLAPDAGWWLTDRTWWGVGVAIRTDLVVDMLAYVAADKGQPYDQRLGGWCKTRGHDVALVNPSMVDHISRGPSLVWGEERAGVDRRAMRLGVPTDDALGRSYRIARAG